MLPRCNVLIHQSDHSPFTLPCPSSPLEPSFRLLRTSLHSSSRIAKLPNPTIFAVQKTRTQFRVYPVPLLEFLICRICIKLLLIRYRGSRIRGVAPAFYTFDDNVSMLMISIDVYFTWAFGRNFRDWIEERCRFVGSLVTRISIDASN